MANIGMAQQDGAAVEQPVESQTTDMGPGYDLTPAQVAEYDPQAMVDDLNADMESIELPPAFEVPQETADIIQEITEGLGLKIEEIEPEPEIVVIPVPDSDGDDVPDHVEDGMTDPEDPASYPGMEGSEEEATEPTEATEPIEETQPTPDEIIQQYREDEPSETFAFGDGNDGSPDSGSDWELVESGTYQGDYYEIYRLLNPPLEDPIDDLIDPADDMSDDDEERRSELEDALCTAYSVLIAAHTAAEDAKSRHGSAFVDKRNAEDRIQDIENQIAVCESIINAQAGTYSDAEVDAAHTDLEYLNTDLEFQKDERDNAQAKIDQAEDDFEAAEIEWNNGFPAYTQAKNDCLAFDPEFDVSQYELPPFPARP